MVLLKVLDNLIIFILVNIISDVEGMVLMKIEVVIGKVELFDCLKNLVDIIVDDGFDFGY